MEPDPERKRPYIWASWLPKLLAKEDRCLWRLWYRAHFKYVKRPDDPERAGFFEDYTRTHDGLTSRAQERLKAEGYVTRVEDDAKFSLQGRLADVAGKPDLVGVKDGRALVGDAKAGRKRASDHWQVLIYLFGLRLTWLQGIPAEGFVEYKDGPEPTRPLGPEEERAIVELVRVAAAPEPPPHSPSAAECRYCDVAACTKRFKEASGDATRFF